MRFIDKTKELWNTEKGNAKRNLLKLILAVPFWLIVVALFLMAFGIGRAIYLIDTRPAGCGGLAERLGNFLQTHDCLCRRHKSCRRKVTPDISGRRQVDPSCRYRPYKTSSPEYVRYGFCCRKQELSIYRRQAAQRLGRLLFIHGYGYG